MKKILFFIPLIFIIGANSFAQWTPDSIVHPGDSVHQAYKQTMADMFANVDMSYVPSGVLYDRGFPFITFEPFKGELNDTSKSSLLSFGFAYAALSSMTVSDSNALPPPNVFRSKMDTIRADSDVIPIAGLHQLYHKIDTNALANNQFQLIDENLYDIFPRTGSPYIAHELFLFAPAVSNINGNRLSLMLDSTLFFSNTGKIIEELAIDFGNDSGFVTTSFNVVESATYDSLGWKNIKIRITYTDSSIYYSHFDVFVQNPLDRAGGDNLHDVHHYITPTSGATPADGRGGGNVYVYLACGHSRIEKPFIWAEGFNPIVGSLEGIGLSTEDAVARINHALTIIDPDDPKTLWENLLENGYDIILIDYDDGGDYIPRTAELIKEVIRWVNIQKHSAGSNEKNVIMGQSMGGVCTNLALKEMEVVDMEDHEVGTFVVFDSPLLGVNVPLGAQSSLIDMAFLPVVNNVTDVVSPLKSFVQKLDDGVNLLFTPAARTMIRYLYDAPSIPGSQHLWQDHYNYQWNELGGYPTQCEVITIANGSIYGEDGQHNFEPGEQLLKVTGNNLTACMGLAQMNYTGALLEDIETTVSSVFFGSLLSVLLGTWVNVNINVYAAPDGGPGVIYYSQIGGFILWGTYIVFSENLKITGDKQGIDGAPGGFVGMGNQGIILTSPPIPPALMPTIFKLQTFCFTPTVSVLTHFNSPAQIGFNDPFHDFSSYINVLPSLTPGLKSYTAFDETVQFSLPPDAGGGVYPEVFYNTAHTWFTNSNTEFMHYHFIDGFDHLSNLTTLSTSQHYNFGKAEHGLANNNYPAELYHMTDDEITESLTIEGILSINTNQDIGLTPSPVAPPAEGPGFAADNSSFLVTMGNGCDNTDPVTLTIEDGGQLILGDGATRTGALHVYFGHKIIVKAGGVLELKEGSTLKLKSGSELIIESGGQVIIRNGAYLITEFGSHLLYHPDAEIHLLGSDAVLEMEGHLNLLPDSKFRLLHDGIASGLMIVKNPQGLISGGANSSFEIIGDGSNDFMLAIMEGAKLSSDGNMEFMRISNCTVALRSGNWYNIRSTVPFYSNNVKYEAQPNSTLTVHPKIYVTHKAQLINCDFNDVLVHAVSYTPAVGPFVLIGSSSFNYTYMPFTEQLRIDGGNFEIYSSQFNGFKGTSIYSTNLTSTSKLYNSTFNTGQLTLGTALEDESDTEIRAQGNIINETSFGFSKSYGKLTLRCNTFNSVNSVNIYAGPNCWLEMTTGANAGYNRMLADQPLGYSILLDNALYLNLKYGYNYFNDAGSQSGGDFPMVYGSVQIGYPSVAKQYLHAHKNQWNVANTEPTPSAADITSSITGNHIPLIMVNPQSATCGFYDTGSPVVVLPGGLAKLPNMKTPSMVDSMRVDSALAQAFYLTEMFDSTGGDDFAAIQLYHEILTYEFDVNNKPTELYLDYGFYEMKATLEHCFATGRISQDDNRAAFHPIVQLYVDVLNERSKKNIGKKKYTEQFNLEISKANLYRLIGHSKTGLDILYNTEACGLDSTEQAIVNHWKFVFEEELAKFQYGTAYDSLGRVLTDTSSYYRPVSFVDTIYYFGTKIISLNDIKYRTCESGGRGMLSGGGSVVSDIMDFELYPNPSRDGLINIEYYVPDLSTGTFIVYSADGKEVFRKHCPGGTFYATVDLSFVTRGVYFYSFLIDGEQGKNGKFILE